MLIAQSPLAKSKPFSEKTRQRRSKGELTRERILLATIDILAVNGIKGTTHRAIANYADIQLSLTTYYFKDINELVQAAFQLNSKYLRAKTSIIVEKVFYTLENLDPIMLKKTSLKTELCEKLSKVTATYLFNNVQKISVNITVEQLMNTTVKVNAQLKELALEHEESELKPFTALASFFNKNDPEIDAQLMRTVFSQLQYHQLSLPEEERSIEPMLKVIRTFLGWFMGLKS
jgi:DNA-binding transcriptional regulator YbjK